jgi:hypothetical protein
MLPLNALLLPVPPREKILSKPGKSLVVDLEPIPASKRSAELENLVERAVAPEELLPPPEVFC